MSAWIRPSRVVALGWASTGRWLPPVTPCEAKTSCISRASRPQERSNGLLGRRDVGSSCLSMPAVGWGTFEATSCQRASEGWSKKRWTSLWAATAFNTLRWLEGRRVRPKSEMRDGKSRRPGSASMRDGASSKRSAGLGTPRRRRSSRQSSACQAMSSGRAERRSASRPRSQARSMAGRWTAYWSNKSARCRVAVKRRGFPSGSAGEEARR